MDRASTCYTPYEFMSAMSLQQSSSYENLCEEQGQVACYSGKKILSCVNSVSDCYLASNGCPVNAPISCDGECK